MSERPKPLRDKASSLVAAKNSATATLEPNMKQPCEQTTKRCTEWYNP